MNVPMNVSWLWREHDRPATVIRMRVLSGLTVKETALALDVCDRTVEKDTRFALGWLGDRMRGEDSGSAAAIAHE